MKAKRERRTRREGMNKRWRGYRDGKKELGEDRRTQIRRSQKERSERRRGKELSSLIIKGETKHLGIAKTVSIVPGMYVCSGLTFLKWLLDLLSALTRAAGAKHLIGVSFKPCCSSDGFSQLFHSPPPNSFSVALLQFLFLSSSVFSVFAFPALTHQRHRYKVFPCPAVLGKT